MFQNQNQKESDRKENTQNIVFEMLEMLKSCAEDLAFSKENCDVQLRQQLLIVIEKADKTIEEESDRKNITFTHEETKIIYYSLCEKSNFALYFTDRFKNSYELCSFLSNKLK